MTERLIFVPSIGQFGGVESLVLSLSRYLIHHGCPHRVVCFSQTGDLASNATWPLIIDQLRPARNVVAEVRALRRYLRSASTGDTPPTALFFDLKGAFYAGLITNVYFHLHLTDPPSLLPADGSKHAPSLRRLPSYAPGRSGVADLIRYEGVHRLNRRGVRRALTVFAMTDRIARELHELYGVEATVVRPGVRLEAPARRRPKRVLSVLSVCRLEPSKRLSWVLEALASFGSAQTGAAEIPAWRFDVVGSGPEEPDLRRLAHQLGISDRVTFHGRLAPAELRRLYRQAQLFVMAAEQGYGLPALDALANNVPVVLHYQSGVSELLQDTPWVELCSGAIEDVTRSLRIMLNRVASGTLESEDRPDLPTEEDWAQQLCDLTGWL